MNTHTPKPMIDGRINIHFDLDRDQAARLIEILARELADSDTVRMQIRVHDDFSWDSEVEVGTVEINPRSGGSIFGSHGTATDTFISWRDNEED
jgi:hypothetical protein